MTLEFRQMTTEEEFREWMVPYANAYPAIQDPPETLVARYLEMSQDPANRFWSVREDGRLVGGFQTLDFDMNYHGTFIKAGGVGNVWVDFLHKKRGVAKAIVNHFLDCCESKEAYLALLYPFRPDFYHDMGFGYGPRMEAYAFRPAALPTGPVNGAGGASMAGGAGAAGAGAADAGAGAGAAGAAEPAGHGLVYLTEEDARLIEVCRNEAAARRHGQIKMLGIERVGLFRVFGSRCRIIGLKEDGRLRGYMVFGFKRYENNFVKNDMVIREWVVDGPETLLRFCAFLRTQADQVNRIRFQTQDEGFHFLLADVRNDTDNIIPSVFHESSTTGVGLMYRIVNVRRFLEATSYRDYGGATADLDLRVTDTFRPTNDRVYRLGFRNGRLSFGADESSGGQAGKGVRGESSGSVAGGAGPRPIDLALDVADLSALLMGSVTIEALWRFGRARIAVTGGSSGADAAEAALPLLGRIFACERPTCLTHF